MLSENRDFAIINATICFRIIRFFNLTIRVEPSVTDLSPSNLENHIANRERLDTYLLTKQIQ